MHASRWDRGPPGYQVESCPCTGTSDQPNPDDDSGHQRIDSVAREYPGSMLQPYQMDIAWIDEQLGWCNEQLQSITEWETTIKQENAPIQRLPAEVLQYIFLFAGVPVHISAVCRLWRFIVRSTPDAWSTIRIDSSLDGYSYAAERIQTYLELAGARLFDTRLVLPDHSYLRRPIIEQLERLIRRSVRLHLSVGRHSAPVASNLTAASGSELQDVIIQGIHNLCTLYELPTSFPNIKSLTLRCPFAHPPLPIGYSTLRHLEVGGSQFSIAWRSVASCLRASPNIETIVLTRIVDTPADTPAQPLSLDRLRSLTIHDMECEAMGRILQNLAMPNSTSLTMRYGTKSDQSQIDRLERQLSILGLPFTLMSVWGNGRQGNTSSESYWGTMRRPGGGDPPAPDSWDSW